MQRNPVSAGLDLVFGPRKAQAVRLGPRIPSSELGPAEGPVPGWDLSAGNFSRNRPVYRPVRPFTALGLQRPSTGPDTGAQAGDGVAVTSHIDPTDATFQGAGANAALGRASQALGIGARFAGPAAPAVGIVAAVLGILAKTANFNAQAAAGIPADQVQQNTDAVDPSTGIDIISAANLASAQDLLDQAAAADAVGATADAFAAADAADQLAGGHLGATGSGAAGNIADPTSGADLGLADSPDGLGIDMAHELNVDQGGGGSGDGSAGGGDFGGGTETDHA
jgi:hypothetical protein